MSDYCEDPVDCGDAYHCCLVDGEYYECDGHLSLTPNQHRTQLPHIFCADIEQLILEFTEHTPRQLLMRQIRNMKIERMVHYTGEVSLYTTQYTYRDNICQYTGDIEPWRFSCEENDFCLQLDPV